MERKHCFFCNREPGADAAWITFADGPEDGAYTCSTCTGYMYFARVLLVDEATLKAYEDDHDFGFWIAELERTRSLQELLNEQLHIAWGTDEDDHLEYDPTWKKITGTLAYDVGDFLYVETDVIMFEDANGVRYVHITNLM